MGSCLSKKSTSSTCPVAPSNPPEQIKSNAQVKKKVVEEEETEKKEILIIKHRKSNDIERRYNEEKREVKKVNEVVEPGKGGLSNNAINGGLPNGSGILVAAPVRTSSCTKEEVDAILIQCGRLSRSSSTGKAGPCPSSGSGETNSSLPRGKKYSGSKRSYDFDNENGNEGRDIERRRGNGGEADGNDVVVDDDTGMVVERSRHRQWQRQSRTVGSGSPSKGRRRRTPSREREQAQQEQRSGSRERGNCSGSGRRMSRSPGRRSESPITTSNGVTGANSSSANANSGTARPGKMVSVPATVSSLAVDKSNNGGGTGAVLSAAAKRIQVKKNAGSEAAVAGRTGASPRSRSPARANVKASNENQNANSNQHQQQSMSLSRSNSRKAEQSPYRRNPLSEIDNNIVIEQAPLPGLKSINNILSQVPIQNRNEGNTICEIVSEHWPDNRICSSQGTAGNDLTYVNCKAKGQQHSIAEDTKIPQAINSSLAVNAVASGSKCSKHNSATKSRSSRLSRDLDINPEALSNPAPTYTALLLEDIQNFHQKSSAPEFSLPACVSKACSILEAVADLNSSPGSNMSSAFLDDKRRNPTMEHFNKYYDYASFGDHPADKKGIETKGPFVQSEVVASNDPMEPSFHNYVTVRRGTMGGEGLEEQESSGSNSFVAGQQHWVSSSSWEPNSADSINCRTTSRSSCREDNRNTVGFERHAFSESGNDANEARRRLNGNGGGSDQKQIGIARERIGSRGPQTLPTAVATSTYV